LRFIISSIFMIDPHCVNFVGVEVPGDDCQQRKPGFGRYTALP
jgi:hypothetical protein